MATTGPMDIVTVTTGRRLRRHARRSGALRAARRTAGAMLNDEQADIPCRPRRDTLGTVYRASQANLHVVGRRGPAQPGGADDELCAMFDESSQCTIVLPVECLGYGLVVPFPAHGFALWFRIMKI